MYYKESLIVKMINISYLQEYLLCEVIIDNIRGCIALIYRSPSQNSLEFQHFLSGFKQLLINVIQFCLVIVMHVQDHGGIPTLTHRIST